MVARGLYLGVVQTGLEAAGDGSPRSEEKEASAAQAGWLVWDMGFTTELVMLP